MGKETFVFAVMEKTPEDTNFTTFAILSSVIKAEKVLNMYQEEYPQNEYKIDCFMVDNDLFLKGYQDGNL